MTKEQNKMVKSVFLILIIFESIIMFLVVVIWIDDYVVTKENIIYQSDTYSYDKYDLSISINEPISSIYDLQLNYKLKDKSEWKHIFLLNKVTYDRSNEYIVNWNDKYFSICISNYKMNIAKRKSCITYYFNYDNVIENFK